MPYPRRRAFDAGERLTASGHIPGAQPPTGRARTPAEVQREYRNGRRSRAGVPVLRFDTHRNGLPWKPYVWRGDR
jgi:hypothetical protein